ncbi:hypothetical protein CBFG_06153 [Clostridiales bacterium 1_7_47FAA]|nr:hypothetical protein CBFG_06153 [Clostridiales bacterium 1_7_47FAA]
MERLRGQLPGLDVKGYGLFVYFVLQFVASSFRVSLWGGGQIRTRSPFKSSALIPTRYQLSPYSIRVGFHLPRTNTSKHSPQCKPP